MDNKKPYRIASAFVKAASFSCFVAGYSWAFTTAFGCPNIGLGEAAATFAAGAALVPLGAYLSIRGSDAPWIENSYRCPVCDYEWLDFDDHPCEAFCFECGEEGIAPYRSRPFK